MNLRKYYPVGNVPLASTRDGKVTDPWRQFFSQLTTQPGPIATVAPTGSPFAYQASESGDLLVKAGTVSDVSLTRGSVTVSTGQTSGFFPMALGDTITVTYTVVPTLYFVPD